LVDTCVDSADDRAAVLITADDTADEVPVDSAVTSAA
jgi:hypothetical protein